MAINTGSVGGPAIAARPLVVSRSRTGRRILTDRWASRLVIVGGLIIIASILAILFVIAVEVYPLFKKPTAEFAGRYSLQAGAGAPAPGESLGVDEYREIAFTVTTRGVLDFVGLKGVRSLPPVTVPGLGTAMITAVSRFGKSGYILGTSDGRSVIFNMGFDVTFAGAGRTVTPKPTFEEPADLDAGGKRSIMRVAHAAAKDGPVTVAQVGPTDLILRTVVETKALIGASRKEESVRAIQAPIEGEITGVRLDTRGEDLFLSTSKGQVLHYDLHDRNDPKSIEAVAVTSKRGAAVTAMAFLLGDRTIVVGDAAGGVSTWQMVPPPSGGEKRLTRIYQFQPHSGPVVAIDASERDKGFATTDPSGRVLIRYGTSGETLLSLKAEKPGLGSILFAPKSDALLASDAEGELFQWHLNNPHPEITLRTVFGKVWYEGYSEPAYVWQSTGGTDDFEAKFSLTPLLYGTLKGTFYALFFAVPLALLAAVYVSEFMHPSVKAYVKPVVEIMAALPSVVLGFLAGLWLAPIVERVVPGLFLLPMVLAVFILGACFMWQTLPISVRSRFKTGTEVFLLAPVIVLGIWASFALGGLVEMTLLGGNYRGWLLSALGLTYDQRNSLVVGLAMGFAVIPIIFTIAEDSLANVPGHLRSGSLALGATRWQTALRIVLPTGSPGIFSAVMIGFGRAVGETMIVLMATGNTPIMDWSPFNGFRALSANVAVELPEAPDGGTLFRVLFLASLLLFCLTFALNTVAELVRLKLRRKYRYL